MAEEILLARSEEKLGANWYLYARKEKPEAIAEAVSKDFFGVRIDCAQCHDHPLSSEILQKHYWGLVAFFNRTKNVGPHKKPMLSESAIGGFSEFSNIEGESFPNELVFLGDRRVEEPRPAKDAKPEDSPDLYVSIDKEEYRIPKFSRRQAFIENVLHDHPLLAKSMVNRMWGWMMGRGLVHPVDAIDSYHPASHPELLDWLSQDFAKSGYDVRRLIKGLAMNLLVHLSLDRFSDPYSRSSSGNWIARFPSSCFWIHAPRGMSSSRLKRRIGLDGWERSMVRCELAASTRLKIRSFQPACRMRTIPIERRSALSLARSSKTIIDLR